VQICATVMPLLRRKFAALAAAGAVFLVPVKKKEKEKGVRPEWR